MPAPSAPLHGLRRHVSPGTWLARLLWLGLALLLPVALGLAATYPANTGRITDAAGILDAATQAGLLPRLKALEDKSDIQLVIATVRSLEGNAIEPYANELFRAWKPGEVAKSNGVLLLVALFQR